MQAFVCRAPVARRPAQIRTAPSRPTLLQRNFSPGNAPIQRRCIERSTISALPAIQPVVPSRSVQTYHGRKHQKAHRKKGDQQHSVALINIEEHQKKLRTVSAVCSAYDLNMEDLRKYLQSKYTSFAQMDEALYIAFHEGEIFFMNEGTVFWNIDSAFKDKILEDTKMFRNKAFETVEEEKMMYTDDSEFDASRIIKDNLYLRQQDGDQARMEKMIVSSAMAKCAYLSQWEQQVDELVDTTKKIPEELESGSHKMTKNQINRLLGKLLRLRGEINLHSNLAETPATAWDNSELEALYHSTARHFDLYKSLKEVNLKLEGVKDVMELIRQQAAENHSSWLEWMIIVLIVFEVIFGLEERGFFMDLWFNYSRLPHG